MPVYRYDHVHLRSADPDAMAAYFERLFGAEIGRRHPWRRHFLSGSAARVERMGTEVVFGMNGHGNWALLDAIVHETKIRGVSPRAGGSPNYRACNVTASGSGKRHLR